MKQILVNGKYVTVKNCGECPISQYCYVGWNERVQHPDNYYGGKCPAACGLEGQE